MTQVNTLLLISFLAFIAWFIGVLTGIGFGKSSAKERMIDYLTLDKAIYNKKYGKRDEND